MTSLPGRLCCRFPHLRAQGLRQQLLAAVVSITSVQTPRASPHLYNDASDVEAVLFSLARHRHLLRR